MTNSLKKSLKTWLLIALFISTNFAIAQKDPYGEKLINMNQYKTAKTYFLNKFKLNPNDAFTNYYLGQIYFNTESYDSANYYFQNGLKLNPNDPYNIIGTGSILVNLGKNAEAEKEFRKAAALTKYKDANIMVAIAEGAISGKNKNYELASEFIQKAKDLDKKLAQIYLVNGDMFLYQSEYGKGANEYENAFYYDKKCTEAYFKLGRIYFTARNYDQSDTAFQNAIRLDPKYIPAWRELSELYYARKNYSKSIEAIEKYLALTEPDLADHMRYAQLLYLNKDYQKSLEETNKALKDDKDNVIMKRLQAYNLFETKDDTNALKSITTFFNTTNTTKINALDNEYYGKILSRNKQDSLAIEYFNKAMQMDTTKTSLYKEIAISYENLKKWGLASNNYENYIKNKQNPGAGDFYKWGVSSYYMANIYKDLADTVNLKLFISKADTAFGTVVYLSPQSHLGSFWKARVNLIFDPENTLGLAKPWYENVINILEPTPEKAKKVLIEAYQYLGSYYYYVNKDKAKSKEYFNKILTIDPNDQHALDALKELK